MENILISGGAGFIGSNLALKLVSLGHNVKFDNELRKDKVSKYSSFKGCGANLG